MTNAGKVGRGFKQGGGGVGEEGSGYPLRSSVMKGILATDA